MRLMLLLISVTIFVASIFGCSDDDGRRDIKYVPMAALERPTNLALNQECIDAWYSLCEFSIFPENHEDWNYEILGEIFFLINKGCVQEKVSKVDYRSLEEFPRGHEQLYHKYASDLLNWRKTNPAPEKAWQKISANLIELISEEWSCKYAYGASACLEFFTLRSRAKYHKRRAESWFDKTVVEPSLHLPMAYFKSLILPVFK